MKATSDIMYNEVQGYKKGETWKLFATHDEKNIKGFFDGYRWLSNFEPCSVEINGTVFTSVENAYQAMKFIHISGLFLQFKGISAAKAKKLANQNKDHIISGWQNRKLHVMVSLIRQKFSIKNPALLEKLLSTEEKYLEETNWWNDTFFGVYKGVGENHLGKLLMEIRKLRSL